MWSSLGDEPVPQHARWVPEPDGRGTYGILSSCLITLTLCVWTCLHLDVPDHEHGYARRVWTKTRWMLMGVVMPETVVWMAGLQWFEQRATTRKMQACFGGSSPPPPRSWARRVRQRLGWAAAVEEVADQPPPRPGVPMRRHAWTPTHSYLAVAGGFAFDNSLDPDGVPFPGGRQRLVVLQAGLCTLARHAPELVPDVSREAIGDKSKTDGVAKLLACLQAVWFCAQMVARLAQHLPLTILELVTFAHAVCAILVYGLWWDKPLDVEEPFLIPVQRGTRAAALCIRLCGNHAWTTRPPAKEGGDDHGDDHGYDLEAVAATTAGPAPGGNSTNYYEMEPTPRAARPTKVVVYGDDVRTEDLPPPVVLAQHDPDVELLSDCFSDRELAALKTTTTPTTTAGRPGRYRVYTLGAVDVFQHNETLALWDRGLAAGSFALSALYSGWQLTAWHGPFHGGAAVAVLWRVAAIAPTPLVAAVALYGLDNHVPRRYDDVLYALVVLVAAFARAFLLVESLVGLAYVPDGGYQTPDWSPYFPHFG